MTSPPPMRWSYSYYDGELSAPLYTISEPSPTGSGVSKLTLGYDTQGRVTSQQSSSGNLTTFKYGSSNTITKVFDKTGKLVDYRDYFFDAQQRGTGIGDAEGHRSIIQYGDPANPYKPTTVIQPDGKSAQYQYDAFGNVMKMTE